VVEEKLEPKSVSRNQTLLKGDLLGDARSVLIKIARELFARPSGNASRIVDTTGAYVMWAGLTFVHLKSRGAFVSGMIHAGHCVAVGSVDVSAAAFI
jgi:hypothetical protein